MPRRAITDSPGEAGPGGRERPDWLRRLGWMALLWLASVAALGVVAVAIRLLMGWAGMTR